VDYLQAWYSGLCYSVSLVWSGWGESERESVTASLNLVLMYLLSASRMTTVTLIVNRTATWGKIVLAVIPSTSFLAYVTHVSSASLSL
jgi:hypothetical protein